MNNRVLIEFLSTNKDGFELCNKVNEYAHWIENLHIEDLSEKSFFRITGQIDADNASFIRLSNDFLAQRMRISYISDEPKNKYRTKK